MENCVVTHLSHRAWRRVAKKERRRRLRREAAKSRVKEEICLKAALEKDADYLNWLKAEELEEEKQEAADKQKHDEEETLWLEREVNAQKEWRIIQEKKLKAKQLKLEQEEKIRREFEAKQEAIRLRKEEQCRKQEEEIRKHVELQKEINDYIDNGIKTPETLREIIDSQPNKELCPFFAKTGACRYGESCSRNHRRVWLSKIILIPGFYTHFSLEKTSTGEYDTDVSLEFGTSEMRQHYKEFYQDIVSELESFGKIKTLKCCSNSEVHLRGNLYVEYLTEREAARALRRLKGRWYAGRKLNCEFVSLISWRNAVCGMSKCPKGRACNFLHTFRNPYDEYDIKSPIRRTKGSFGNQENNLNGKKSEYSTTEKSKWDESVRSNTNGNERWRWSESPEVEINSRNSRTQHSESDNKKRDHERECRKNKRYHSDRLHVRSSRNNRYTCSTPQLDNHHSDHQPISNVKSYSKNEQSNSRHNYKKNKHSHRERSKTKSKSHSRDRKRSESHSRDRKRSESYSKSKEKEREKKLEHESQTPCFSKKQIHDIEEKNQRDSIKVSTQDKELFEKSPEHSESSPPSKRQKIYNNEWETTDSECED